MAAPSYCEIGDVKIVAQIPDGDTSRDDLINFLLPKVSRHIDRYCRRFFFPKTASWKHDFQSRERLWLRTDLHSLTSITNGDGTTVSPTAIFLYPVFGPPYQRIDFNHSSSQAFLWTPTTTQQAITVTGVWGWLNEDGETPEEIVDACASWISYILKLGPLAGVKSRTIGDYSVSFSAVLDFLRTGPPNEVSFYLEGFKRSRFGTNDPST